MDSGANNPNQFQRKDKRAAGAGHAARMGAENHGAGAGNSPGAFQSLPAWQRERNLRLHKIFLGVEDRIRRGQTLDKAVRYFSNLNRDRFYKSEPARRVQFSYRTLVTNLYLWRSGGRSPEAVALRYVAPLKIRDVDIAAFLRAAARPSITSFAEARAALRATETTSSAYWYALDERTRRTVLRAFDLRREAGRMNRRADKMFGALLDKS